MLPTTTTPLIEELHREAAAIVSAKTVAPITYTGYQAYLTTGDRRTFEDQYFQRRKQLVVLGLSQYLAPEEAKGTMLNEVLWAILNEYTWGLPAHMPVTGNTYGDGAPYWLDLFAAETGEALAELKFLIGAQLPPELNHRIDVEIERRIFTPFAAHDWAWQHKTNNWSAVIGGCIGITAIYQMSATSSRLQAFRARLDTALTTYLASFGDDGASEEGVSYWAYGFGYYLYYAELAARRLGDDHYLQLPKVRAIAAFPEAAQLTAADNVPFSDYGRITLPTGLLNFCRQTFKVPTPPITTMNAVDFDHCYRFAQLYRDLLWAPATLDAPAPLPASDRYFQDVQWWLVRAPEHKLVFAAKGGRNDESHNHIDLGHIVFGTEQTLFLTDLGAGEYTRDYFDDDKRYAYFPPAATAHDVPIINGQTQQFGPYAAKAHPEPNGLTLTLTAAYPTVAGLGAYTRHLTLAKSARRFTCEDTFAFAHGENTVVENLVTLIPPTLQGEKALLEAAGERCVLSFPGASLHVTPQPYRDHDNHQRTAYRIQAEYTGATTLTISVSGQLQ